MSHQKKGISVQIVVGRLRCPIKRERARMPVQAREREELAVQREGGLAQPTPSRHSPDLFGSWPPDYFVLWLTGAVWGVQNCFLS